MSKELPPPSSPTNAAPAIYLWPWGQVALLLIALGLCLNAAHDLMNRFEGGLGETMQGLFAIPGIVGFGCALFAWWSSDRLRQRGDARQSNPRLRRLNFGLGGLWLFLILLQILIPAVRAASAASGQATASASSDETKVVSSANGAIAMRVPTSWTEIPPASRAPASLAYLSPTEQMGVAIYVEARRDLTASNATEYAKLVHSRLLKEFEQIDLLELTTSSQPGTAELQEQVEVAKDGEKLRFLLAYQERPTLFIHLRAWGPPSVFEENETLLSELLNSVHLVGGEAEAGVSGRVTGGNP